MGSQALLNSLHLPHLESEWDNLLTGQSVDLNHILASGYSIKHEENRTEQIGDIEIIIESHKAAKTVKDHDNWATVWDDLVNTAYTYVFPHHKDKLQEYGHHVNQLFKSAPKIIIVTFMDLQFLWIQTGAKAINAGKHN